VTACECCYIGPLYFQDSQFGFLHAYVLQVRLSVVTVLHVERFRSAKSVVGRISSRAYLRWAHLRVLEVDSL
jgi:hypothetical protein